MIDIEIVEGVPNIEYGLTPITDETFIRQGWEKKIFGNEDDVYYMFEEEKDSDIFPDDVDLDDDDLDGDEDMEDDSYYWVLKLPRDNPMDKEECPVLISTISDELVDGIESNQYVVQIYDFFGLGICFSEEEIEILYRSLTGNDIYDF
jgi:hypothetical protein